MVFLLKSCRKFCYGSEFPYTCNHAGWSLHRKGPQFYGRFFRKKYSAQQHARVLNFSPTQAKSRYSHVLATFEASASALAESMSLEAKDALRLLEFLAILHSSGFSPKFFGYGWQTCQEARAIHHNEGNSISTLSNWPISQLADFLSAELNEWDDYRLQEASNVMYLRLFF